MKSLPALTQFISYLRFEKNLSHNTHEAYCHDLEQFRSFCERKKIHRLHDVDDTIISSFCAGLWERTLLPATIRRTLSSLRAYFSFMAEEGLIDSNPAELLQGPRSGHYLPDVLTVEEVFAVLESVNDETPLNCRNRAMLEVLYGLGVRVSELSAMKLEQVDFDAGFVRVFGKGSKERLVPLGSCASQWVQRYLSHARPALVKPWSDSTLFLNNRGKRLSRMGIWKIVQRAVADTAVTRHVSPHTFRHSCATHMIEGGADVRLVQEFLGHASITTTEIYTHIDTTYLREVHQTFHPRSAPASTGH